jgi:MoaA/NifB/PqqE/SkfB family radical SAM enzyme
MYDYEQIKDIHLEISSLCNAECPICNRRLSGGPKNPIMIERAVTLGEFKAWFPIDLIRRMKQLTLCGNYGDPMTAPDLISILRYFRSINSTCAISMNTNAGGRDAEFWKDLAEVIGKSGRIVFSVDGLEDTNHLYRKGVNWEKVMTAMKAVTSTKKVRTVWEFLVFKHNQHQIAEARKLSEDLGMDEFWPKKAIYGWRGWNFNYQKIKIQWFV